jgi:acetolactate synthase-1/2/3 large subunit
MSDSPSQPAGRTGAEALVQTFVDAGVRVCFTNPGTSEMHFVAALDTNPQMRCVLGLFEGVVTGAADGYGRMAGTPAATLLHLGPGLGNGLANLHNAKKARTPVVNVVGDHATYHRKYDAPLTSDVEAIARPVSGWVKAAASADTVAADGAAAIQAALAPPGQVATLILPADTAWDTTTAPIPAPLPRLSPPPIDGERVLSAARALASGEPCVLLINGVLTEARVQAAARIAAATGARLVTDTFVPRMRRGAGLPAPLRLPYFGEQAAEMLAGTRHIILLGTQAPVTFFAYPGKPYWLTPEGCTLHEVAGRDGDLDGALDALGQAVGASGKAAPLAAADRPALPSGKLDARAIGAAVGHLLPENAVVVDEGGTSGHGTVMGTRGAPAHDWLQLTGGSIGYALPTATGAAIAAPGRRVLCLQGDGGGMYTVQALWTQARERLDITTVIFANRRYGILQVEFGRVGAHAPGPKAMSMLELTDPTIDWMGMARSMGVTAWQADSAESFNKALAASFAQPGPSLIEALI